VAARATTRSSAAPATISCSAAPGRIVLSGGPGEDLLDGGEDHDAALLQRIAPIAYADLGVEGVDLEHGEYIAVPHQPAYELAEGTIQLWFKADNALKEQALLAKDAAGLGAGELLIWLDDGDLRVKLESATDRHVIRADNVVRSGTWYQLTFTFGPQGMKLYLDGALVGQNAYTGGLVGNTRPVVLGGSNADDRPGGQLTVKDPFNGRIDEVALFGSALTPEQIAQTLQKGANAVVAPADVHDVLAGIEEVRYVDAPAVPAAPAMLADSAPLGATTYVGPQGRVELGLVAGSATTVARAPAWTLAVELQPPMIFERLGGAAEWLRIVHDTSSAAEEDAGGEARVDWSGRAAHFTLPLLSSGKAPGQPNIADFRLPGRNRR
jgi:hypothetical protein